MRSRCGRTKMFVNKTSPRSTARHDLESASTVADDGGAGRTSPEMTGTVEGLCGSVAGGGYVSRCLWWLNIGEESWCLDNFATNQSDQSTASATRNLVTDVVVA
jgi:hypothetical protein